MNFRRTVLASLSVSMFTAIVVTALFSISNHLSLIETVSSFWIFSAGLFALVLFLLLFETQFHKEQPFKEWFILCGAFLGISLVGSFESLQTSLTILPFLPFNIISLAAMTRSYQLMSLSSRTGGRTMTVRGLSISDRALIILNSIGFFIVLGLGVFFLHWMPA
jgi:hypothetical protein